jgi:flagellar basal-body rod modification protein FlgD
MAIDSVIPKTTPAGLPAIDAKGNPALASLKPTDKNSSKATGAGLKLADDFDSFLKLLTTQLQNQDPTEPLDTNQFTQQLVAFSGVEQSVQTNKNLESLISLSQGNKVGAAVGYIGKVVDTEGTQVALSGGNAVFNVDVPFGAASVTVGITDLAGKPIYSETSKVPAGSHDFGWNGDNSFGGAKAADGIYTYGVVARDSKGNVLTTKTYTSGKVTSVSQDGESTILTLTGGLKVPIDKVSAVREAPVLTPTTTTTGNQPNNQDSPA